MKIKNMREIVMHRKHWEDLAKKEQWYTDDMGIQFFIKDGHIVDSVSFIGLNQDVFTAWEEVVSPLNTLEKNLKNKLLIDMSNKGVI